MIKESGVGEGCKKEWSDDYEGFISNEEEWV